VVAWRLKMEDKQLKSENQIYEKLEIKYANIGLRFLSFIIDGIVLWCIYTIIFRIFFFNSLPNPETYRNLIEDIYTGKYNQQAFLDYLSLLFKTLICLSIYFLISIFYKTFLVGKFGATLGKMITGIKIVDENGNKISYGVAFIREVLIKDIIYFIIFFISWLGYLWALWDKKKQTWHDKIARTLVVKE
jgi:uncharacterized RDD family membrane protein YckC